MGKCCIFIVVGKGEEDEKKHGGNVFDSASLGFGGTGRICRDRGDHRSHAEPAKCNSCHSENPTEDDVLSNEYRLLADSIDDTCHICHPYDCCRINSLKGHNHVSNVGKWDVEKFTEPETLPLFDGMITCNTCHYHRMKDVPGDNYRMVRLVEVALERVDWTRLCADCHVEY